MKRGIDLTGKTTEMRVNAKCYLELEDGHRTMLVIGMADTLECMTKYLDAHTQTAFIPLLEYCRQYEGDDLRLLFDNYVRDDIEEGNNEAIASWFLSMLIDATGALK